MAAQLKPRTRGTGTFDWLEGTRNAQSIFRERALSATEKIGVSVAKTGLRGVRRVPAMSAGKPRDFNDTKRLAQSFPYILTVR